MNLPDPKWEQERLEKEKRAWTKPPNKRRSGATGMPLGGGGRSGQRPVGGKKEIQPPEGTPKPSEG